MWYFRDFPSDLSEPEEFAITALRLLKPWREEKSLLSFKTWKDALDSYEKRLLKELPSVEMHKGVADFRSNADGILSDSQKHRLLQLKILSKGPPLAV